MEKRLDNKAVAAIVAGTVLIIITNSYMSGLPSIPVAWSIQICTVFVVITSAVFGILAGVIMPVAASVIVGIGFLGPAVLDELLLLLLFGVATGHYSGKFMVRRGEFTGIRLFDYCMIEVALAVLAWICIHPLGSFYLYGTDLRISLNEGVRYCGITILANLFICLPVLLLCNRLFKKKRIVEDAEKEYLYRS